MVRAFFGRPSSTGGGEVDSAIRFGIRSSRVPPDGNNFYVTETVVFRFIDGTFKRVFREVPVRRTDGVEFCGARIDGQTMPFGNELGTVSGGARPTAACASSGSSARSST